MKVFSYTRVSGRGQVEGDGKQRQLDSISRMCREHNLEHCGDWFEAGISGTVEGIDRPRFSEMLDDIEFRKKHKPDSIDAIVVERMDRLARDLMVSEVLLKECRTRGIKVFAADSGVLEDVASDSIDPTRKLVRQILAALAEWEKSALVKKLAVARARVKAKTGRCEGRLPYGCRVGEQAVVEIIKSQRAGGRSYQHIADFLNSAALKTPAGKQFGKKLVFSIYNRATNGKV